jgi:hypothetical protein
VLGNLFAQISTDSNYPGIDVNGVIWVQ